MARYIVSACAYSATRSWDLRAANKKEALQQFLAKFPQVAEDGYWNATQYPHGWRDDPLNHPEGGPDGSDPRGGFWRVSLTEVDLDRPDMAKFWQEDQIVSFD